jgi:protein SCO1/2
MNRLFANFLLPMLLLVLAGCEQPAEWNGRDISGLMPPLEFELTGEDGEPMTEEALDDQVVALFFGYTHCPDVCPPTLARLAQAIQQLPEARREQVEVLFVSVDPERDSPERLKKFTDYFGDQVTGATGKIPQLRKLTQRYRTTFSHGQPDEDGNYTVSHGQAVYLFDRSGEVRLMVRDDISVDELASDLERLADS